MKKFVVDLKPFKRKACRKCRDLMAKFRPWDDSMVPDVILVEHAECKACRMTYDMYDNMIWPIPMAMPEEVREIERQLGKERIPTSLSEIERHLGTGAGRAHGNGMRKRR